MSTLLPYYERELAFLRQSAAGFAEQYPKIAGRLQLSADVSPDPHVERMIESFALLAGRVHKRLDDDFPLFTESLLEVLYPHYLRPFPACSIVQFDGGAALVQATQLTRISRGTDLSSPAMGGGVTCKFKTTQDVCLLPIRVSAVSFRNSVQAPDGTALPSGVTAALTMTFELTATQMEWASLRGQSLRFFLDGEPSVVSVLREALCRKVKGLAWQVGPGRPWVRWNQDAEGRLALPTRVGFDDGEAMLAFDARSNSAYRLLTEYFAYPEKFNFVDIPMCLPPEAGSGGFESVVGERISRQLTLHLLMADVRSDSNETQLLESVESRHFQLGCTPVINLFQQPAEPIRVTHETSSYPVVVDARRAHAYEVYSVDKVFRVKQTPQGESVDEFHPFFSLRHADVLSEAGRSDASASDVLGQVPGPSGRYWALTRNEDLATTAPGYETELTLVDQGFQPVAPQVDTLSLTVTATNRDLPSQIPLGGVGGDFFLQGGSSVKKARMLRKPTVSRRFEVRHGGLWRLISHLSLNHLSLSGSGIEALKEMMRLYDLPASAANRRQIDGLQAISYSPSTAWLAGEPFATFVRGTKIRLEVDEASFVGTGLGLFVALLDRFFALFVHANSFTQLTVVSARTQEELVSCPPRSGDMVLV